MYFIFVLKTTVLEPCWDTRIADRMDWTWVDLRRWGHGRVGTRPANTPQIAFCPLSGNSLFNLLFAFYFVIPLGGASHSSASTSFICLCLSFSFPLFFFLFLFCNCLPLITTATITTSRANISAFNLFSGLLILFISPGETHLPLSTSIYDPCING